VNNGIIRWQLKLPPNTRGRVIVKNVSEIRLDGEDIENHGEIKNIKREGSKVEFSIDNGFFEFTIKQ
jgi:hypothetical protein